MTRLDEGITMTMKTSWHPSEPNDLSNALIHALLGTSVREGKVVGEVADGVESPR